MNAKRCKRLRRRAREATIGMPARRLLARQITVHKGKTTQAVNDPQSTRGVYLAMKREANRVSM